MCLEFVIICLVADYFGPSRPQIVKIYRPSVASMRLPTKEKDGDNKANKVVSYRIVI